MSQPAHTVTLLYRNDETPPLQRQNAQSVLQIPAHPRLGSFCGSALAVSFALIACIASTSNMVRQKIRTPKVIVLQTLKSQDAVTAGAVHKVRHEAGSFRAHGTKSRGDHGAHPSIPIALQGLQGTPLSTVV